MRNLLILSILILAFAAILIIAQPQAVEKPIQDGRGPLAIKLDARLVAPEYHSPLEWWKPRHMGIINNGDWAETKCLQCHNPATSCNNCHSYVGVRPIRASPQ